MEDIRGPRFPESSPPSESTSEKKKKSKKKARFPLSDIAKVDEAKTGSEQEAKPKHEPTAIEAALASLAAKKNTEQADNNQPKPEGEKPKEAEPETSEPLSEEPETGEGIESDTEIEDESVDSEAYETLPRQDIGAQELGGGEVVLDLQGDEPIAERVLLLQDTEPAPSAEPVTPLEVIQAPTVEVDHDDPEDPPVQAPTVVSQPAVSPRPASVQGGGNLPPQPPNPNTPPMPVPGPNNPNNPLYHNAAALPPNPNVVSAATTANTQTGPTKQDVEDAAYYAHKAGVRRGLGTGLIVGGAYEHFKHRRREKKAQKEYAQQAKRLEKSNQDLQFSSQEQTKKNQQLQEQVARSEQVADETKVNVLPVLQSASERLPQTTPESRIVAPAASRAEKPVSKKEVLPVQIEDEQIVVPEGHRIETSAWHTIEIDKKTGKAVETPTFQYGREYYRERAQENVPVAQKSTVAGGLALTAIAGENASGNGSHKGTGSSSHIPDATVQGPPSRKQKMAKSAKDMKDSAQSAVTDAAIWPWAVALLVIVVTLLILL